MTVHTLSEHFIRYVFDLYFRPMAVAYPLLHTTVMCGHLHYCHLPVSFGQSGPSPLTSELLLTGCFLFFTPFSANSRD